MAIAQKAAGCRPRLVTTLPRSCAPAPVRCVAARVRYRSSASTRPWPYPAACPARRAGAVHAIGQPPWLTCQERAQRLVVAPYRRLRQRARPGPGRWPPRAERPDPPGRRAV